LILPPAFSILSHLAITNNGTQCPLLGLVLPFFNLFVCRSNSAPLFLIQNLVMQHVDHSAGDFIDLLKRLLAYEPSARLTAQEALSHVFFTRYGKNQSP
jgi:serine/threonine protein kinase